MPQSFGLHPFSVVNEWRGRKKKVMRNYVPKALLLFLSMLSAIPLTGWAKTKIVLIAGRDSHGSSAHNWGDGVDLLSNALVKESGLAIETAIHKGGWPSDPAIFKNAATVVILSDGGGRHPINKYLKDFDALAEKGVGLVCVHYGVEVPKGAPGTMFLKWIGGYFETFWSVNPHWTAEFKSIPKHPVANGVKPFTLKDEWYYHMRFREGMKGVTPILSALPPADTLKRKDGPHSNNPAVRKAVLERRKNSTSPGHRKERTDNADSALRGLTITSPGIRTISAPAYSMQSCGRPSSRFPRAE